jgi:hypothetical protein
VEGGKRKTDMAAVEVRNKQKMMTGNRKKYEVFWDIACVG